MRRLAGVLGCTEGQAYTLTIGLALACLLLVGTVPAALREPPARTVRTDLELAIEPAPQAAVSAEAPPEASTDDPESAPATTPAPFLQAPSSPTLRPRVAATPGRSPRATDRAGAPSSTTTAPTAPTTTTVPEVVPTTPLVVLEGGWATAGAGTPAARANVPPDTLPVAANAGGSTTRRSFVRLQGSGTVLTLRLKGDAGATVNDTAAAVLACAITDAGWAPREAVALEAAPPFDPKRCVGGARQNDGSWRFDLSAFDDRSGRAGFTLLPDPARTTAPFQVAYEPTPGAPS